MINTEVLTVANKIQSKKWKQKYIDLYSDYSNALKKLSEINS